MKITSKITLLFLSFLLFCPAISAQSKAAGKLDSWTLGEVASREKDDEILPVSYKMRVSKNKGFDRIVFEFIEKEVPEYSVRYVKAPLSIDAERLENSGKQKKNELDKIKENDFLMITFALGFQGKEFSERFAGERNLPVIADIIGVDWFENFYTFAVVTNAKKPFRVQELSNPTRLVVDFKNSGK